MYKPKRNNQTRIDIDLNNAILTYKTISRIFLSVVEFLSYNRNQIPLVYGTFNNMVQNLEKAIASESITGTGVKNFTLERQRELAIRTNKKFQEIFEVSHCYSSAARVKYKNCLFFQLLLKSFKKHEFSQGIIIFGATIFTAKEAFVITLPDISKNHLPENHLDSVSILTRKVIMSIITSTEFFNTNASELKPTNMFILMKTKEKLAEGMMEDFQCLDYLRLPTQCRVTRLDIRNNSNGSKSNCCHNISIFNESISVANTTVNHINESTEMKPNENGSIQTNESNFSIMEKGELLYACKISVKGFRDQLNNGTSIWI